MRYPVFKKYLCGVVSLLVTQFACADQFWTNTLPAVKRGTLSTDLYIFFTPSISSGALFAETEFNIDPNKLSFVELAPVTQAHSNTACTLKGGRIYARVESKTLSPLTNTNIAICRIRIRPDQDAPIQNYALKFSASAAYNYSGQLIYWVTNSNGSISVIP